MQTMQTGRTRANLACGKRPSSWDKQSRWSQLTLTGGRTHAGTVTMWSAVLPRQPHAASGILQVDEGVSRWFIGIPPEWAARRKQSRDKTSSTARTHGIVGGASAFGGGFVVDAKRTEREPSQASCLGYVGDNDVARLVSDPYTFVWTESFGLQRWRRLPRIVDVRHTLDPIIVKRRRTKWVRLPARTFATKMDRRACPAQVSVLLAETSSSSKNVKRRTLVLSLQRDSMQDDS